MTPKPVPTKTPKLRATRHQIPAATKKQQTAMKKNRRPIRGPIPMNPKGEHSPARVEKAQTHMPSVMAAKEFLQAAERRSPWLLQEPPPG